MADKQGLVGGRGRSSERMYLAVTHVRKFHLTAIFWKIWPSILSESRTPVYPSTEKLLSLLISRLRE